MENELKILYKDEDNLKLRKGIGICNLYVFNDGDANNARFWVISKSKKVFIYFELDFFETDYEDIYCVYHNNKSHHSIHLKAKDQKQIFDYIFNTITGDNSNIWSDMLNAHNEYFGSLERVTKNDMYRYMIKEPMCDFIEYYTIYRYLGNRLGMCKLNVTNMFPGHPSITISSCETGFNSIISLMTGNYMGLDKLTDHECMMLQSIMSEQNDHHLKHSLWAELYLNTHLVLDGIMTREERDLLIEIFQTDNTLMPHFEYCANIKEKNNITVDEFNENIRKYIKDHNNI